jgi:hypothetical protein
VIGAAGEAAAARHTGDIEGVLDRDGHAEERAALGEWERRERAGLAPGGIEALLGQGIECRVHRDDSTDAGLHDLKRGEQAAAYDRGELAGRQLQKRHQAAPEVGVPMPRIPPTHRSVIAVW